MLQSSSCFQNIVFTGLTYSVTLTFDLLTPKVDYFFFVPRGSLAPICNKMVHPFLKYYFHKFAICRPPEAL